ncbi:MAG: hypothetical protein AAGH15_20780, partial [Myxococcota bacterium]
MDGRRQPIARGDLAKAPLQRVLLGIARRTLDGTLVLWPDAPEGAPDRLRFEQGRLTGLYLVHGTSPAELLGLFERRSATYAFYDEDLLGDRGAPAPVDVPALVAASLRTSLPMSDAERELARVGGVPLSVAHAEELERFELNAAERAVVEDIGEGPALAEDVIARAASPEIARRVIYLLAIGRELVRWVPPAEQTEGASRELAEGPGMTLPPPPAEPPPSPAPVESLPPRRRSSSSSLSGPGLYGLSTLPPAPETPEPVEAAQPEAAQPEPEPEPAAPDFAEATIPGLMPSPPPAAREASAPPPPLGASSRVAATPTDPAVVTEVAERPRASERVRALGYDPAARYQEALRALTRSDPQAALDALGNVLREAPHQTKLLTLQA